MLAILLKILSVVGIILLVLLGITVFLLLVILFSPLRYKIVAKKDLESYDVKAKITWLFRLVKVVAKYPEPGKVTAHVLFFKVFDTSSPKKSKEKKNTTQEIIQKNDRDSDAQDLEQERPDEIKEQQNGTASHTEKEQHGSFSENDIEEKDKEVQEVQEVQEDQGNAEIETEDEKSGEANVEEKENIFDKIHSKIEKLQYTAKKICDRIKNVKNEAHFYKKLVQDEKSKLLFENILHRSGKILKAIRPKKLKADIYFGASTPDITGYVCGIYGIVSSFLGKDFHFTPDFNEERLEGNLYAVGHTTFFVLLIQMLKIYFDKNFKIFRNRMKKHSVKK